MSNSTTLVASSNVSTFSVAESTLLTLPGMKAPKWPFHSHIERKLTETLYQ